MSAEQSGKFFLATDEFYKSPIFLLGSVGLRERQFDIFNRRWNALRQDVKLQLLKDAPRLAEHKKLTGDQLPEIHAVDIFQSESYYRLEKTDPGFKKEYWKRQYAWLEQALAIISSLSPSIIFLKLEKDEAEIAREHDRWSKHYKNLFPGGLNKKRAKIYARISSYPYYWGLPIFISGIDDYLSRNNLNGTMLFDDFDHSKGFHEGDVFDLLRRNDILLSNFSAQHTSSLAHNILQAADVVSYVRGRLSHSIWISKSPHHSLFNRWHNRYIAPHAVSDRSEVHFNTTAAMTIHLALFYRLCLPHGITEAEMDPLLTVASEQKNALVGSFLIQRILNQNEPEPTLKGLAPSAGSIVLRSTDVKVSLDVFGAFKSNL